MGGVVGLVFRKYRFLNHRSVVVLLIQLMLLTSSPVSQAHRRTSALNLAAMRIYTAELQLRESGRAATVLGDHCRAELEAVQEGLQQSNQKVASDPEEARRQLVRVEDFLQSCGQNLSSVVNSQAYDLLVRVGQSVASAANLIDQSEITAMAPPSQEVMSVDSSELEFVDGGSSNSSAVEAWVPLLASRVENKASRAVVPAPQKLNFVMTDLVVDFCPNHVEFTKSSASIRLDRSCGGKFHSRGRYSSGVFSIRMRAPAGASGVSNSFYISSNDDAPDVISFDFMGNEPNRVLTAYAVNGNHDQKLKTFQMGFDTTSEFHEYTIKWDADLILWMVEDVVIRTLRASRVKSFPTKPGHIYGYSWDASAVADGSMAGRINWYDAPYFMSFTNLQVAFPLFPGQWRLPQQRMLSKRGVASPVRPLVIEYSPNNVATNDDGDGYGVDITFDKAGCGSRVRSLHSYSSGQFSARIKCAEGDTSGLLTSFYISSGEGSTSQDEIDFEFLGDNKQVVQTNFYVNGTSTNEQWVELDYDCSSGFHTYAMHFDHRQIQWFVDGRLVRTVVKETQPAYPVKKMFLYSSVWNASDVNDGAWTGKWHGMEELPFVARFKDVTVRY